MSLANHTHSASIALLLGLLLWEQHLFRPSLSAAQARRLVWVDLAYGASAGLVLLTGAIRVMWLGKGWQYYLYNGWLQSKMLIFVLISMLSLLPTLTFLNWRAQLQAQQAPTISARSVFWVTWVIRGELVLLAVMALLATRIARG
ncbi:DUF2214 family protein [Atopomonas sediminilitoris]|uniref:DUF2214 family protein n=1 Tax=Atopomonas sediminilitoris TaxID=2919919 RepID=UPI001F4DD929|nr:DUF2214 family protein [Atopomonas sediminilitoris]MCJ8170591.1 DUF2214 family protein [Atopomonas sediminilitoris]